MDALVRCLELKSPELSRRVVAEMYEDPFWEERFGERGRRFAEQDGQYHVSYLVSALALSNPDVMTGYARWLQSLLVSRGMCSRHIAENFERLERAIAIEVPDAEPAIAMLHAASEALRYDAGLARELQDRSESLADAAAAHQGPPGIPRGYLVHLLAYLADAMALVRPELFCAHVVWLAGFLERRRIPAAQLRATLEQLEPLLAAEGATQSLCACVSRFVAQALERLTERGESPSHGATQAVS
jgi:hypothetical protein